MAAAKIFERANSPKEIVSPYTDIKKYVARGIFGAATPVLTSEVLSCPWQCYLSATHLAGA